MSDADRGNQPPGPGRLVAWMVELAASVPGVAEAFVPGVGVDARTRQHLLVHVADRTGAAAASWVHRGWLGFLGERDPDEHAEALLAYATTTIEEGRAVDVTVLAAVYRPDVVRSTRAVVGLAQVSSLAERAARRLVGRVRRRAPWSFLAGGSLVSGGSARSGGSVVAGIGELATVVAAAPVVVPLSVTGTVLRLLGAVAPALPPVRLRDGPDANLVAQLLAESLPAHLSHAAVRAVVVCSPLRASVAFASDEQAATVVVGRNRVDVRNGVAPGVLALVDGGLERLLPAVASSLLRDLVRSG